MHKQKQPKHKWCPMCYIKKLTTSTKASENVDCQHYMPLQNMELRRKNCRPWLGFWNSARIVGFHKQVWQQSALESAIKGLFHVNIGDGIISYFGSIVEIFWNIQNYGFINEIFASKMQNGPMGSRHNVASYQTCVNN